MKQLPVLVALVLGGFGSLALSGCTVSPLTSTSPSGPMGSVCEGLFGDPLDFSRGSTAENLPLIDVMGDPQYELRCTYGHEGTEEFILAVTALDRRSDRARIADDLVSQGFSEETTREGTVLTSAGRFGLVSAEIHLVTDESWIRVTAVSMQESPDVLDHAQAQALIAPWLVEIDQRIHTR